MLKDKFHLMQVSVEHGFQKLFTDGTCIPKIRTHITHKMKRASDLDLVKEDEVSESNMDDAATLKILLVDDHQIACRSTAILLEMSGYKVRTAFNGRTAIEIAPDFSPDIIILDIGLPDIDGYELLSRLKRFKELQSSKFIALTGFEEEIARPSQIGFDFHYFLRKPVDTTQLKALLNA